MMSHESPSGAIHTCPCVSRGVEMEDVIKQLVNALYVVYKKEAHAT